MKTIIILLHMPKRALKRHKMPETVIRKWSELSHDLTNIDAILRDASFLEGKKFDFSQWKHLKNPRIWCRNHERIVCAAQGIVYISDHKKFNPSMESLNQILI